MGETFIEILKIVISALSGGAVTFAIFMITRSDTAKEKIEKKNDQNEAEHEDLIKKYHELNEKIEEGLEERENTSLERYIEQKEAIEELREIMKQLAKTDIEHLKIIEANSELLVGLAQDRLVHLTKKYQHRGAITLDELAILEQIYDPYHNKLKGNGRGKAGVEYCQSLKVVSNEEALKLDEKLGL